MRRLALAVGFLAVFALAGSREVAACENCKPAGFICGVDECWDVWICQDIRFGMGNGMNDCYTDSYGCYTSGGFCQWASHVLQEEPLRLLPPVCHEAAS